LTGSGDASLVVDRVVGGVDRRASKSSADDGSGRSRYAHPADARDGSDGTN
jgi:hypothetical protein